MAELNCNQRLNTEELLIHKLRNTFDERGLKCLGNGYRSKAIPA
ncbi:MULTISPECIES: hypothetical protein [Paenibacillus]|nr:MULTISPECIES: hypothetical protein [Paenibacillus]